MTDDNTVDDVWVSHATLLVTGEDFEPAVVSKLLGLAPFRSGKKGDQLENGELLRYSFWKLAQGAEVEGNQLPAQLFYWTSKLENKSSELAQIKQLGCTIELLCFFVCGAAPTVYLENELLAAIGKLGIDLRLEPFLNEREVSA